MKITVVLNKTFEIDTDKDWNGDDGMAQLISTLKDVVGIEPGETATKAQIEQAIVAMMEDDIEYVLDLDLDPENDFTVTVPAGTTLDIPEDEEEGDE